MVIIRSHIWHLKRTFPLIAYFVSLYLRSHWHLSHIDADYFGETRNMFAFRNAARRAWLALKDANAAPLIHFYGGSTYGAYLTLEEMTLWLNHVIKGLNLKEGVWALHYHLSGRLDYHILSSNVTRDGKRLHTPDLIERMRELAREATSILNANRLAKGLIPIGNLTKDGEVFYVEAPTKEKHQAGDESSNQTPVIPRPEFNPANAGSATAQAPHSRIRQTATLPPVVAQPSPAEPIAPKTDWAPIHWLLRDLWGDPDKLSAERLKRRKKAEKELAEKQALWEAAALRERAKSNDAREFLVWLHAHRELEREKHAEEQKKLMGQGFSKV